MGKSVRIIVAGGRRFNDYVLLTSKLNDLISDIQIKNNNDIDTIEIVSGMAEGTDFLGIRYGFDHCFLVHPCEPQFWIYGKQAGLVRNKQMAEYASQADISYLCAFWNGKSEGTKNMIDTARIYNINVEIVSYSEEL